MLHIKYRPRQLKDVIGNDEIKTSLKAILKRDDPPRVYLFTGPTGNGKTTLARIMADKFGASDFDTHEINSADFRGIDTIRDIRKQIVLAPLSGPIQCWIINEIHQSTRDAQNAMLVMLEDTPPHIFFFLTTTDPQKLLKTIKSRCVEFAVKRLEYDNMEKLLEDVYQKETEMDLAQEVVEAIYDRADGSARKALTLLSKVLDIDMVLDSTIKEAVEIINAESADGDEQVIELCRALMGTNGVRPPWKKVAKIIAGIQEDQESVRHAVLGYCAATLMKKKSDDAYLIMTSFQEPFYNTSGKVGLLLAAYEVIHGN